MTRKLRLDALEVTTFEAGGPLHSFARYTPDCCTDGGSGCDTGPETGCGTDEPGCPDAGTQQLEQAPF